MKTIKAVALAVDWMLAIAVAAAAMCAAVLGIMGRPIAALGFGMYYLDNWGLVLGLLCAGLFLLALNFLALWATVSEARGGGYLRLGGDKGRVSVSLRAIEDTLQRAVMTVDDVAAARVKVSAPAGTGAGSAAAVRAYVTLRDSVVYHEISKEIIAILEARFGDIVSSGTPVETHLYWEKIKRQPGRAVLPKRREPDETLRPQFPIDEGQDHIS